MESHILKIGVFQDRGSQYGRRLKDRGVEHRRAEKNMSFTEAVSRYHVCRRDTAQRSRQCHCAVCFFHPHNAVDRTVAVEG